MANKESWALLMKLYFNCDIKGAVETAWFVELRHDTTGWRHNHETDGPDPCKGARALAINNELCDVIRYIKDLPTVPRKNQGKSKDEAKGKPTVIDLGLWVWLYRKNRNSQAEDSLNMQFVDAGKMLIDRCINQDQRVIAALVAGGNPLAADMADFNELFAKLGNRSFSDQEQAIIRTHCDSIGFSPKYELEKFYEQSTGKKHVSQYATDLSDQYNDEDIFQ